MRLNKLVIWLLEVLLIASIVAGEMFLINWLFL